MASPGWQALGNAIGGGNKLPGALAYEQGVALGANTQDALAQARARIDQNNAKEGIDTSLAGAIPDPKQRAAVVGAIQAGVDPRNITGAQLDQFKLGQQQAVADPTTSDDQAGRSLAAIGQPGIIRAVGDNGNMINELHPSSGVQISPLGSAIANATVGKSNADAALATSGVPKNAADTQLALAQANLASVNAANGGAHVATGYAPLLDANGQQVIDPSTGRPKLIAQAGGPADINAPKPMGAVALRSINRMLDSAQQSTADIQNISAMPAGNVGTGLSGMAQNTLGALGYGSGPQKGLIDSVKADLTNRAAPETQRAYTTLASGLSRSMASLEAAGMVPNGQFTDSFNKLQNVDGDTNQDALLKLAQMRQITENALNSMVIGNVSVPADRQKVASTILDNIEKAVPFTVQDVNRLHNDQSGTMTLAQIAGVQRPTTPTIAPGPGASHGKPVAPEPPATEADPDDVPAGPKVGTVEGGFRFMGGDPSKASSWGKI